MDEDIVLDPRGEKAQAAAAIKAGADPAVVNARLRERLQAGLRARLQARGVEAPQQQAPADNGDEAGDKPGFLRRASSSAIQLPEDRNPIGQQANDLAVLAGQGLTLGFLDEVAGFVGGDVDVARERVKLAKERVSGARAFVAETAPSLLLPGGAAAKGVGTGAKILRGAVAGGAAGAVLGAGAGEEDVTLSERLDRALVGGGVGAAGGVALGGAGAAGSKAIQAGGKVAQNLKTKAAAKGSPDFFRAAQATAAKDPTAAKRIAFEIRDEVGEALDLLKPGRAVDLDQRRALPSIEARADAAVDAIRPRFDRLEEAFPTVESDAVGAALRDPAIERHVRSALRGRGKEVQKRALEGRELLSLKQLRDIRRKAKADAQGARQRGEFTVADDLEAAVGDLNEAIGEVVGPEYREADRMFAIAQSTKEQFARGNKVFRGVQKYRPEDVVAEMRSLRTPEERLAFGQGVVDSFLRNAESSATKEARISRAQFSRVMQVIDEGTLAEHFGPDKWASIRGKLDRAGSILEGSEADEVVTALRELAATKESFIKRTGLGTLGVGGLAVIRQIVFAGTE